MFDTIVKKPWLQITLIIILCMLTLAGARWQALLSLAFLSVLLLIFCRNKQRTKSVEKKLVIEALSRGGYVLKNQDAGGNLTFELEDQENAFDKN